MNRLTLLAVLFFPLILFGNANDSVLMQQFLEIQASHINANVPDSINFENYLKRDLNNYFKLKNNKEIEVTYDFLRKGPTQSGVSYPKYYLWVFVRNNNKIIEEGAVRIAAIEKIKFEITNYLSKEDIIKNEATVASIFPRLLIEDIIKRAKHK